MQLLIGNFSSGFRQLGQNLRSMFSGNLLGENENEVKKVKEVQKSYLNKAMHKPQETPNHSNRFDNSKFMQGSKPAEKSEPLQELTSAS